MPCKEKYRALCLDERSIPIFSQAWWLDAVCGQESWDVAIAQKAGRINGCLPFFITKSMGFKIITMPPLTQTMGPWFRYPANQKYEKRLKFEKKVMSELISQLPNVLRFRQNFHYSVTNWLPFYWHGFQQTTHYTYVLDDLNAMNAIWVGLGENIRREIRKARKRFALRVVQNDDIDQFLKLNEMTFSRQGKKFPYRSSIVRKLDMACQQRQCRKILFAQDKKNQSHAAIYIVWDDNSTYYLMGGADPSLRNSGASSLLIWEAIKFASTVSKSFDFEGSMIEPVEHFFRAFGSIQKPFSVISKDKHPLLLHCLTLLKSGIRRHRSSNIAASSPI